MWRSSETFYSALGPGECKRRLEQATAKDDWWLPWTFRRQIVMRAGKGQFRLRVRRPLGRDSFEPLLYVQLAANGAGTSVHLRCDIHPLVRAFMTFWFLGVTAGPAWGAIAAVIFDPEHRLAPLLIPVLALPVALIGYGISHLSQVAGREDAEDLKNLVRNVLEVHPESRATADHVEGVTVRRYPWFGRPEQVGTGAFVIMATVITLVTVFAARQQALGEAPHSATSAIPLPGQGLSAAQLSRVVLDGRGELERCYDAALNTDPTTGSVALELELGIDRAGTVVDVQLRGDASASLKACIDEHARRWTFPSAERNTRTAVPLMFRDGPQLQEPGPSLGASELSAVIRRKRAELQACYESALHAAGSNASVTLNLTLQISRSGTVTEVTIEGASLLGMHECVDQRARRWHFPTAAGSTRTSVPLNFEPGEDDRL